MNDLRNNIVMRNYRRNEELRNLVNYDWTKLSYVQRAALIYAYEHEKLRPKDFIKSNPKIHSSNARKNLKDLVDRGLLERIGEHTTSPDAYYVLKIAR